MYRIGERELAAIRKVFETGHLFRYRGGRTAKATARFERDLAAKIGVRHALATSSGTGALICGLVGLGVGPGDEVIVPAYTFISTALAPLAVGAVPVICEVDESLTIDPADCERKISRYTKAIVPVHMLGLPCDMRAVLRVARRRGAAVVEDAAQAAGGSYRGRRFGSMGDLGILSFNHYKIISCGEGGAVLTDDKRTYQRAMIYHDGGCVYFHDATAAERPELFAGNNYRASEIHSAIMGVQLRRLDGILKRLRARKAAMLDVLAGAGAFRPSRNHDPRGDCATTLPLLFGSADAAAAFVAEHKGACEMFRPIETDRHVYSNWEPILRRRAHHPGANPFRWAPRKLRYSKDMCPRTTDILSRTVCVLVPYERTVAQARSIARRLRA